MHNSGAQAKACDFLISKQRSDGGWAESYLSSQTKVHTTNCSSAEASLEALSHHSLVHLVLPVDRIGQCHLHTPTRSYRCRWCNPHRHFLDIYEVPLSCMDVYAAPMITQMLHHVRVCCAVQQKAAYSMPHCLPWPSSSVCKTATANEAAALSLLYVTACDWSIIRTVHYSVDTYSVA